MLLIDNAAYSFGHQVANGIPILSYYQDPADKELLYLTSYLESIVGSQNLKEKNSKAFQLECLTGEEIMKYLQIYKNMGEEINTDISQL